MLCSENKKGEARDEAKLQFLEKKKKEQITNKAFVSNRKIKKK